MKKIQCNGRLNIYLWSAWPCNKCHYVGLGICYCVTIEIFVDHGST